MALVKYLEEKEIERPSLHKETSAKFAIIPNEDGNRVLQIDTYGSEDREMLGKVSQSLQFGSDGVAQLKEILNKF